MDYLFYLSMAVKGQGGASWRLTTRPEYRATFTLIDTQHKSDIQFKNNNESEQQYFRNKGYFSSYYDRFLANNLSCIPPAIMLK